MTAARNTPWYLQAPRIPPVAIISFMRSGTHFALDTLRRNFDSIHQRQLPGQNIHNTYVDLDKLASQDRPLQISWTLQRQWRRGTRSILIKTHTLPELNVASATNKLAVDSLLRAARRLYVYRDVRPVLASYYVLWHAGEAKPWIPFGEFLRMPNHKLSANGRTPLLHWKEHIEAWLSRSDQVCISFENWRANYEQVTTAIGDQLGLGHARVPLAPVAKDTSNLARYLKRLAGSQESSAVMNKEHLNSPLSWRDLMSDADKDYVKQEVGTLLISLGYEKSHDW